MNEQTLKRFAVFVARGRPIHLGAGHGGYPGWAAQHAGRPGGFSNRQRVDLEPDVDDRRRGSHRGWGAGRSAGPAACVSNGFDAHHRRRGGLCLKAVWPILMWPCWPDAVLEGLGRSAVHPGFNRPAAGCISSGRARAGAEGKMMMISMLITAFAPTVIGHGDPDKVSWPFTYLFTIVSAAIAIVMVGRR